MELLKYWYMWVKSPLVIFQSLVYFTFAALGGDPMAQMVLVSFMAWSTMVGSVHYCKHYTQYILLFHTTDGGSRDIDIKLLIGFSLRATATGQAWASSRIVKQHSPTIERLLPKVLWVRTWMVLFIKVHTAHFPTGSFLFHDRPWL